jgi:MFS family permease
MTTTTNSLARERAAGVAHDRWLMLIVLLAGQFMALLDVTIVNVAMPTIGRTLHATGPLLQLALVVTGAALALGFSPLVTHALVRVPLAQAADASGLLTTTIQLGQAVGVATFGSLFLTWTRPRGLRCPGARWR